MQLEFGITIGGGQQPTFFGKRSVMDRDCLLSPRISALLQKAVDSIVATFRRRVAAGLQSGRDFVIPERSAQANDTTDFELITWLVIKT